MNNAQALIQNNRRNQVIFTIIGIGLLLTGIFWGLGIAEDFTLGEQDTHSIENRESQPLAKPALTRMPIMGDTDIQTQNDTLIRVAKLAQPAVVNISTSLTATDQGSMQSPFFDDPLFRRFFGEEFERRIPPQDIPQQQGTGSGVIVRDDGYIITNNHVVEAGDEFQVTLSDKRSFKGELVGTDPKTDLALLKIDADNLPVLSWGNSRDLQVGEIVMAIGSPFGLTQTVTMGIVSAVGRANVGIVDYEDFIQTDAAINPGNSGGALVNLKGELIGINTAIFSRSGGYMGIGFAIPSNMAKSIQSNLVEHGKVVRGWLGVSIQDLTPDLKDQFNTPDTQGALVSEVIEESPAEKAGIQRGDIIRHYESETVTDTRHLRSLVAESLPKAHIKLQVLRDGKEKILKVTIAEMPKDMSTLASTGKSSGEHALAGITVEPSSSQEKGVKVTNVDPKSPANRSGIREGDIILEINRQTVTDIADFERLTRKLGPQDKTLLLLQRGRSTIFLSINP